MVKALSTEALDPGEKTLCSENANDAPTEESKRRRGDEDTNYKQEGSNEQEARVKIFM